MNKKSLGQLGENAAVSFLEAHGYEILERNFCIRTGEIDIIAKKEGRLSFIEVKTRCDNRCGTPAEAVTHRKQQKIIRTALSYLNTRKLHDIPCSFDVIEVYPTPHEKWNIRHLADAFEC